MYYEAKRKLSQNSLERSCKQCLLVFQIYATNQFLQCANLVLNYKYLLVFVFLYFFT
jgi:hypothetical protein